LITNTGASKVNRYRIEAVDRALTLLDTLASIPGANASQLATALDANRSLVFRMLNTLADRGYVVKDANNLYRLGPRLLYLGQQAEKGTALMDASRDVLDELAKETEENIYLIVREGLDMLCLSVRISPQPIRLSADVGTKGGLHTGGAAKMLLAYSPSEIIDEVLDRHLDEFVPKTLTTREQVNNVLNVIRRDGYYEAIGEINPETYTLNAAVRDGQGGVVAVLSIAGPTSRLDEFRQKQLLQRVRDAAAGISKQLGHWA
jgi:IclR family KDG regulon transcriptional repressor